MKEPEPEPDAKAGCDRRRAASYQPETGRADEINAQSAVKHSLREPASSMGSKVDQTAARAEARVTEGGAA